jgi:hypothetical protein
MITSQRLAKRATCLCAAAFIGFSLLIAATPITRSQDEEPDAAISQQRFETPEMAAQAFVAALATDSVNAFLKIFGTDFADIVLGSDPASSKVVRRRAHAAATERLAISPIADNQVVLLLGQQEWPMPIPLARTKDGWMFDTAAGAEEILTRWIGENELSAIDTLRTFVQAQQAHYAQLREAGQPAEYARYVQSSPGSTDGLWWDEKTVATAGPSPLTNFVSQSREFLEGRQPGDPFKGYYFRVLTGQGDHATGGTKSYFVNGRMTDGFAIIAWPMSYRRSGVMTFLVDQSGRVLQKDLGEETASVVNTIRVYDPDESWQTADR